MPGPLSQLLTVDVAPKLLRDYKHPEVDRILFREHIMVLSKIIFYVLQDGCRLLSGIPVSWLLGFYYEFVVPLSQKGLYFFQGLLNSLGEDLRNMTRFYSRVDPLVPLLYGPQVEILTTPS